MRALADGLVDAGPLMTDTLRLYELPALLKELDNGKIQCEKVPVAPNG